MNRFQTIREYLSEIQEKVGHNCVVSCSYSEDGFSMIISFHDNEKLPDEEFITVEFEESDFQDSEVYEKSVTEQILDYAEEFIDKNKEVNKDNG